MNAIVILSIAKDLGGVGVISSPFEKELALSKAEGEIREGFLVVYQFFSS